MHFWSRSRDGMQPLPRVNSLRKMWPSAKWVQDLSQPRNAWNLVQKKQLANRFIDGGDGNLPLGTRNKTFKTELLQCQKWTGTTQHTDHWPGSVLAPEQWLEDQFRLDQQTSTVINLKTCGFHG